MAVPTFRRVIGKKSTSNQLVNIDLEITETLTSAFQALGSRASHAAAISIFHEAEDIMAASKAVVPYDTGNLHASGHVQPPVELPNGATVTLGYGGPSAPYAIFVHEILTLRHKPGKQAKYLEQPMLAAIPGIEGRLSKTMREQLLR